MNWVAFKIKKLKKVTLTKQKVHEDKNISELFKLLLVLVQDIN